MNNENLIIETDVSSANSIILNNVLEAVDDFATADEDDRISIRPLRNDRFIFGEQVILASVDGNNFTGSDISLDSGAILSFSGGTFFYNPNGAFSNLGQGQTEIERIPYVIASERGLRDEGIISITIRGKDPLQPIDDVESTDEDSSVNSNVLINDINPNGIDSDLRVIGVNRNPSSGGLRPSNVGTQIELSSGALLRVNLDGTYTYNPNGRFDDLEEGQSATDSFFYLVGDGSDNNDNQRTARVEITIVGINDPPIANPDDNIRIDERSTVNGNVLTNDNDVEGDTLTVTQVNGSSNNVGNEIPLSSGALLTLNADGTYTYNPNGQFNGLDEGETANDSFSYTISDGNGGSSTTTVDISIDGITPALFGQTFDLNSLNGNYGFVINGIDSTDLTGGSVSNAGDLNGDGIDDIIIGAIRAGSNGKLLSGKSYVIFGNRNGFEANLELSSLDGSNGFVINGIDSRDFAGGSVSSAGDLNGDGIDDIIIGAEGADLGSNDRAGESYVIFGDRNGFEANLELSSLDGNNGFIIQGDPSIGNIRSFGKLVSNLGDVNNDGIDDVIITASIASYVVFGKNNGFIPVENIANLDGSNGFVIRSAVRPIGNISIRNTISDPANAGDINGDGIDDIIVSERGASKTTANGEVVNNVGRSYIVFGTDTGFDANLELSNLNGNNGFIINGIDEQDNSGASVSNAGDVNNDGIDDIIIGAPGADPNQINAAGEIYIVFGTDTGFDANLELSNLNGNNGFIINGIDEQDNSGASVSSAGDVNNDGIDDIIISAPGEINKSFVIFGKETGFSPSFNLSELDGKNGFSINAVDPNDDFGESLGSAGDVNGDGIDDLVIGAPGELLLINESNRLIVNPDPGKSYVIFGRSESDSNTQQKPSANSNGDPYITTFDSLYYESSATGEFVAVRTDDNNFEIQVRQENTLFLFGGDNVDGVFNTALAIKVGEQRVGLYAGEEQNKLRIDGELVDFQLNETIELENGSVTPTDGHQFIIDHDNGSQVIATVQTDLIDYEVVLGEDLENSVTGILGNNNGDPFDDLQLSDGTVLPQGLSTQELYEEFATSWRVTQSESLFDYESDKNTTNFADLLEGENNLIGTSNDDSLFAGEGNDIIVGGDGNDTLNGGKGDDTLIGGSGEDTFVFQDDFGNDTITDFEADDTIDVSSSVDSTEQIFEADSILSQVGSDAVLNFDNDNSITLVETQVDSLSDSNFSFA